MTTQSNGISRGRRRSLRLFQGTLLSSALLGLLSGCLAESPLEEEDEFGVAAQKLSVGGFVVVSGDDADDGGHCQGKACGGIYVAFLKQAVEQSKSAGTGILAIGVNGGFAQSALISWNKPGFGGPGAVITIVTDPAQIKTVDFSNYAALYIPSASVNTSGGINNLQIAALNTRKPDIATFVNAQGGSLVALTQAGVSGGWGFLPVPLTTASAFFADAAPTPALVALVPGVTKTNLSHCCFHNVFIGPEGYSGLSVLATHDSGGIHQGKPVILGGPGTLLTAEVCNDDDDNDGDGNIDGADQDCWVCGDGDVDPFEACDDGNKIDGDGCSAACARENAPPLAACENVTTCNDAGQCSAQVSGLGANSSDPDGDPLTVTQSPAGPYAVGTNSVLVEVSDGQEIGTCQATVTVNDCEPPSISCPASVAVECTGNQQALVSPPAMIATDNCGASVAAPAPASLSLGVHALSYTATDVAGNTATCTTAVTVVDTTTPLLTCPDAIVTECTGNGAADVVPGAAQASDVCSDMTINGPSAGSYPLGTTVATYTATDTSGNASSCTSTIQVVDSTPPLVTTNGLSISGPLNHKFTTVHLSDCGITVTDTCGGVLAPSVASATITCVTSDEAPNVLGNGNATPDIVIVDEDTVSLRVERKGLSDGRVYEIHFRVTDASGNVSYGVCPVGIPPNMGGPAVDSGDAYQVCRP
ncbi:HYR domain-containing protein [Polyangium sp. 6x1]|uniref:HYR domain-containing protein n=1 Tax=Polyangium sp. 6x1 TaxID=3042689 RepID=UPI00248278BE|nr:HYR domain-containing protein [Polyangium sp. 6x1]MDI1444453.1 HYR domain-containing protein [Polyangium sp. 6x1]